MFIRAFIPYHRQQSFLAALFLITSEGERKKKLWFKSISLCREFGHVLRCCVVPRVLWALPQKQLIVVVLKAILQDMNSTCTCMSFLHPLHSVTLLEITSKPSWKHSEGDWAGPPMEMGVAWVDLIHLLWETSLLLTTYEEAQCRLNTVGILCFPPHRIYCSLPQFSPLILSHFRTAVEWS